MIVRAWYPTFVVGALAGALAIGYAASVSPSLAVMLVVALFAVTLFVLSSRAALLALVFLTFFEDLLPDLAGGVSAIKLVGALVIGSWVLKRLVNSRETAPAFGVLEIFMLTFAGALLVSMVGVTDGATARSFILRYVMFFALAILVADQVRSLDDAEQLAGAVVAAATASAGVGVWYLLFGGEYRAQGPLGDPNDLAFALSFGVMIGFFMMVRKKGLSRLLLLVALAVMAGGVAATLSRGALAGIAAGVLWGVLLGRVRIRYLVVGLVAVCLVVGAVYAANPERISFAVGMKQGYGDTTVNQRFDRWYVALRMFASEPVTGVGVGHYGVLYEQYGGVRFVGEAVGSAHHVAHNMYLEVLAETGILGFVPFMALMGLGLWYSVDSSRRLQRRERLEEGADPDDVRSVARLLALADGSSAAMVTLLVASLFLTEQYFAPLWILLGLVMGLNRLAVGTGTGEQPDAVSVPAYEPAKWASR
ncbi:MAG: O-antigen ligase family protein [Thermoleophilia bacterium]